MDDTSTENLDSETAKARGILMTFSTLVLLGWYFGAELSQVNILGNSIKLQKNTDNVWLVLSIGNFYFLIRYMQKLGLSGLRPDEKMRSCFERALIATVRVVYRKRFWEAAKKSFAEGRVIDKARLTSVHPAGEMKHIPDDGTVDDFFLTNVPELKRRHQNRVVYSIPYRFDDEQGRQVISTGSYVEINPSRAVILMVQLYSFLKGIVLTPWLSERVLPLIYGLAVLTLSLYSWCAVKWP